MTKVPQAALVVHQRACRLLVTVYAFELSGLDRCSSVGTIAVDAISNSTCHLDIITSS